MTVESSEIAEYVRSTYPGLYEDGKGITSGWGEHAFYYNPDSALLRGAYFITLKHRPTPADPTSAVLVEGAYRLSIRLSPEAFQRRFGRPSSRFTRDERSRSFDYRKADQICPFPSGEFIALCILSPTRATFETLKPDFQDAYSLCQQLYPRLLKAWERRKRHAA